MQDKQQHLENHQGTNDEIMQLEDAGGVASEEIANPVIEYPRDQINEEFRGYGAIGDYWIDKLAHYDELEITRGMILKIMQAKKTRRKNIIAKKQPKIEGPKNPKI
jgi:hypothetical protein